MTVTSSTVSTVQDGDLADRLAIRDVLDRYAYAMDRRDPALMRTCFTPDADLSYLGGLRTFTGAEFADRFVATLEPFGFIDHHLSSVRIVVDGDVASADVHICATMEHAAESVVLVRWVRLTDEFVREPSGWRISRRRHVPYLQYEAPKTPIDFPGIGGVEPADAS